MDKIDNKKLKLLKNTNKSEYKKNILNILKKLISKIKLNFNSMKKVTGDIRYKKDFNFDYKTLTREQIEKYLKKETYKSKYFNILTKAPALIDTYSSSVAPPPPPPQSSPLE